MTESLLGRNREFAGRQERLSYYYTDENQVAQNKCHVSEVKAFPSEIHLVKGKQLGVPRIIECVSGTREMALVHPGCLKMHIV